MPDPAPYLTVAQYCERYHWIGERTLRHWIFEARANGANAWIRRIGRSVVIDVAALHAWIDEHRADEPAPAAKRGAR